MFYKTPSHQQLTADAVDQNQAVPRQSFTVLVVNVQQLHVNQRDDDEADENGQPTAWEQLSDDNVFVFDGVKRWVFAPVSPTDVLQGQIKAQIQHRHEIQLVTPTDESVDGDVDSPDMKIKRVAFGHQKHTPHAKQSGDDVQRRRVLENGCHQSHNCESEAPDFFKGGALLPKCLNAFHGFN